MLRREEIVKYHADADCRGDGLRAGPTTSCIKPYPAELYILRNACGRFW
jgi:hypothetical protein